MTRLLVSVRSAEEALAALSGGANLIDVKEPTRGALGRADANVWSQVEQIVSGRVPLSVALGEIDELTDAQDPGLELRGRIAYRKVGFARAGTCWAERWAIVRSRWKPGPPWVAVAYADWREAGAPSPQSILDAAFEAEDCGGVLVDTWDKTRPTAVDLSWHAWFAAARARGLITALAGGLDEDRIESLAALAPDYIAVRGAACRDGDRNAPVDPARVARLVRMLSRT